MSVWCLENINPVNKLGAHVRDGGINVHNWGAHKGASYARVNSKLYQTISDYSLNNPIKWYGDKFHTT